MAATTLFGLIGALPAAADPVGTDEPGTASEAKTAWEESQRQAEISAEALNGAKQAKADADAASKKAAAAQVAAEKAAGTAKTTAEKAAATAKSYQSDLDQFASATFRGARTGTMSLLLTADSAEDFLDQATAVERVAADTHATMDTALQAKADAATESTKAASAAVTATQAATEAATAAEAATKAETEAAAKKTAMDTAVSDAKALYDKLSEEERLAAERAAEQARRESEARAAALAAQQAAAEEAAAREAAAAAAAAPSTSAAAEADTLVAPASEAPVSEAAPPAEEPAPTTEAAAPPAVSGGDQLGQIAAQAALTKVGAGYCYACDGPDAFDCSGLTTWAWGQAGIGIPRASYLQAELPSVPLDQLQPGDLVTYYSPVSHVAIYVGDGMVVSAATYSVGVVLVPVDGAGPNPTGHRVPR
ncbi:hypothetical protein GIS00_15125 [Nakamurella sp. YIM 132087]|uniref:NlpC/P60 domain-containing protein n=1 Tax=Nakamurella alba TaxID=2665158 RepID=A0A7K1FPV2_9ACTN|nr:C40 family peptidase [Nakamurella alba]MTD15273.1 hypothetical protein [Nakamurella alba]